MTTLPTDPRFGRDVVVIGGCGHVGLPLAIALASRGAETAIYDISHDAVKLVGEGTLPFDEPGAEAPLREALSRGLLDATTDASVIGSAQYVVVVIGTPVDEHLNPDPNAITRALGDTLERLRPGQVLVLRSTVYPGVTDRVQAMVDEAGLDLDVAFCPERIAEGKAMTELFSLPQIVSATSARGRERAEVLFRLLTDEIVHLEPLEAELAKLFTNTYRYIKFAAANQLYMMANDHGLDFDRIRTALAHDYPRAADLPRAGFAAGPCLFKDTMQLAAFTDNSFGLGHAAMLVNEGLPLYLVNRVEQRFDLSTMTVGILGMAFKGGSDDVRSSLAYKLKRVLEFKARRVLTSDPFVTTDPALTPLADVLREADLLFVAAPHRQYADLDVGATPVADVWGVIGRGVRV